MFSNYSKRPVLVPRPMKKGSIVEKAGYVTAEQKINGFIQAGINLTRVRENAYDTNKPGPIPLDPTRRPGYDLVDAATDLRREIPALMSKAKPRQAAKPETPPPTPPPDKTEPQGAPK